jgi:hypothetical protein
MHLEIVKSRYYLGKFEEICRIFLIAFDKSLVSIYYQGESEIYFDPQHSCLNMSEAAQVNCAICYDQELLNANWERSCNFEEEMWVFYLQNKELFSKDSNIITAPENGHAQSGPCDSDIFFHIENIFYSKEKLDGFYEANLGDFDLNQLNRIESLNTGIQYDNYNLDEIGATQTLNNALNEFFKRDSLKMKKKVDEDCGDHVDHGDHEEVKLYEEEQTGKNILLEANVINRKQKFLVKKCDSLTSSQSLSLSQARSTIQKRHHKKLKLSFFKDFNFKFTKRENIDKKILRKSRKFIKDKFKKNKIDLNSLNLTEPQKDFWVSFSSTNLLPPMKYQDKETQQFFDFRSFNTAYILWLFSHKGAEQIFDYYLQENVSEILESFISKFKLNDPEEINMLAFYVNNLSKVYSPNNQEPSVNEIVEYNESYSSYPDENTEDIEICKTNQNNCDIFNDIKFYQQ